MSNHKTLSPSKASRWAKCPGSVRKIAALLGDKESPSSAAADDGTHTHYLLEQCLTSSIIPEIGKELTDHVGTFTVDADRMERVQFVLNYVDNQRSKLDDLSVILSEEYLDSTTTFGRDDMGGTADIRIISASLIEVIDLKDGMNPVYAERNLQMIIYALLTIGTSTLPFNNDQMVRLTIAQPKMRMFGQSGIDSWEISRNDLMLYLPKLIEAARLTEQDNAPLVPGDEQCRYCPAKGSCLALVEHSLAEGGISFGAVDLPGEVVNINASELSNERLRSLIMAIPLIQTMIGAAEEEALTRFKTGNPVDGLKVVTGRGSRNWNCDDEAVADRLRRMGVPKDAVYKTSVLTPAQALKVKWKKKTGEEKELSKRQIKALDEIIEKKEGKLKVVSIEAPGTAVDLMPVTFKPVVEIPDWMK